MKKVKIEKKVPVQKQVTTLLKSQVRLARKEGKYALALELQTMLDDYVSTQRIIVRHNAGLLSKSVHHIILFPTVDDIPF